jgi:hypothetical protein
MILVPLLDAMVPNERAAAGVGAFSSAVPVPPFDGGAPAPRNSSLHVTFDRVRAPRGRPFGKL